MKKHLLFLFTALTLLLVPTALKAQTTVTIGDGSSTSSHWAVPVNTYYSYSLTQQIYTAAEINMPNGGTITSISFEYTYNQSFTMSGIQVYMKNVSKNTFEDADDIVEVSYEDKVFEGSLIASGAGWVTLTLNSPFHYDGTSNLLVCFYDPTNGFLSDAYQFRTTSTIESHPDQYLTLGWYNDNNCPDLDNLSSFSDYKDRRYFRANIRLTINPDITEVYVTGFSTPAWGEHPDYTWSVPAGANYYIHSSSQWMDLTTEDPVTAAYTFNEEGHDYSLLFIFKPIYGYHFADYVSVIINGSNMVVDDSPYNGGYLAMTTPFHVTEGNTVAVGDENSLTYNSPYASTWNYSFVEHIYTADEIGVPSGGKITSIRYNMDSADEHTDHITVYMKNISRSGFSSETDYETVTDGDIVYEGDYTFTRGWNTILLNTPFQYNGTDNLMIAVHENTPGSHYLVFNYTSKPNSVLSFHSLAQDVDPAYPINAAIARFIADERANIELDIHHSATVNDGISTNSYIPVYGHYADAYLKAEFVTPAELLTNIPSPSKITSMTFYAAAAPADTWEPASFKVFLKEVPSVTLSDFTGYSDATVVYEGALHVVNDKMTITFTTPYTYHGGNLLIGVYNMVEGNYKMCTWHGLAAEGTSIQGYSYSSLDAITPTQQNFLPKTTFTYTTTSDIIDFETGNLSQFPFNNNSSYPWTVMLAGNGSSWCMMSGNAGVASSTSTIEATYTFPYGGYISFDALCQGEGTSTFYDKCIFYIDETAQFTHGADLTSWNTYSFNVTPSTHTFKWSYTKDSSVNPNGDGFFVDNIEFAATSQPIVQIGESTVSSVRLPTSTRWKYSLTEQIYTAAEIGQSGDIYTLAFYGTSHAATRDLNIYMVNTDKSSFSNASDWVAVSSSDLVFSGNVNFHSDEWTTIELTNPFHYSNSNNLLIVVDDNTGSYEDAAMNFRVFNTPSQAIYYYSDVTNNDPSSPVSVNDGLANVKNQIQLGFVPPACYKPTNLAITNITDKSAELDWTENGTAYAWQICLDGDILDLINVTTFPYTLSGLTPGTSHTVMVRASCGSDGTSGWSETLSFTTELEPLVQIGNGITTNSHLPTTTSSQYSMTEQIYTATEIGRSGNIYTLAFYNIDDAVTRDLDIYMVNTNKSSFADNYDWVAVSSSDLVFSGNVNFLSEEWTTIELTNPFYYSGSDNLLIVVNDNTGGTWVSGRRFRVFESTVQALYHISDNTSFDPFSPDSYNGYISYDKNQIQLGFEPPACQKPTNLAASNITPNSATITWTGIGNSYTVQYRQGAEYPWQTTTTTTASTQLGGLTPETTYEVQVQSDCGSDGTSNWSESITFTTTAVPVIYSTANWYAYAVYSYEYDWDTHCINFSMQDPTTVTVANSGNIPIIRAAAYTDGYMWFITNDHDLGKAVVDNYNHTISNFETIIPDFEPDLASSMSYNPIDGNMYYITTYSMLKRFDPTQPDMPTEIGLLSNNLEAIAINSTGEAYGVENPSGDLYYLDLTDASTTLVGSTGVDCYQMQDMAFDTETGELFWAQKGSANALYWVNPATAETYSLGHIGGSNNSAFTGLFMVSNTTPSCPAPTDLTVSDITENSAELSWTESGTATGWQICVNGNEGSPIDVTENPYTFTGLTPNTSYTVKVRANCGDAVSDWSTEELFTTTEEAIVSDFIDFETNDFSQHPFNQDASYPWIIVDASNGCDNGSAYCMKSGNEGEPSSTSTIEATHDFSEDGYISFDAKCMGEGEDFDVCRFYIDGNLELYHGNDLGGWNQFAFAVTAGTHTFTWSYTKDGSVDPEGDGFFVDNIEFGTGMPCVAAWGITVNAVPDGNATVTWQGYSDSYTLQYMLEGSGDWNTVEDITDLSYDITGLAIGNYVVRVAADCDPGNWASTTFSVVDVNSTANWYAYALYSSDGESWEQNCINFSMQDPSTVAEANWDVAPMIYAATYADGYMWYFNTSGDLGRAVVDNENQTISDFETIVPGLEPSTNAPTSMSYNPIDGRIYYNDYSIYTLKSFDPAHPETATETGTTSISIQAFAINSAGEAYCVENLTGNLYHLDLTDASTTLVGPTGYSCDYVQAMAFDMETGELFWAHYDAGYSHSIYLVNTATAETYSLGSIGGGNGGEFAGLFMVGNTTPTCPAPTNLEATNITKHTAELSWTENGTASEWQIMVNFNEGDIIDVYGNPYILDNLTAETEYTVMVRANCGGMWSDWSNEAHILTLVGCQASNDLSMESVSYNTATLTWTGEGESYNLEYSLLGSGTWETVENILPPYTLTNLFPGSTYEVHVIGNCGTDGFSNWSNTVEITTPTCPMPSGLTATNVTKHTADLSWIETGSSTEWEISLASGSDVEIIPVTGAPSYTLTGLTANTEYTVMVQSNCEGSWSGWGEMISFITPTGCEASNDLAVTDATYNTATLTWTGEGESFNLQYRTASGTWVMVENVTSPYTLEELTSNTNYEVQVQNNCGTDGLSDWSNLVTFTTLTCPAPTELTVTNTTKHTAVLSWIENGSATEWQMMVNNDEDNLVSVTVNPFILDNLAAETEYTVMVRANCGGTWSDWSNEAHILTEVGCQATNDLAVMSVTPNTVTLDWSGEGETYDLQFKVVGDEWVLVEDVFPPYTLIDLVPNTSYEVQVMNDCGTEGTSLWSNTVTFITTSCPVPTYLTATSIDKHSAILTWNETGEATEWQIMVNNNEDDLINVSTNPYTLENLAAETEYTVQVRANCGGFWSDWSNEENFITPIGCQATNDLEVTNETYGSATLTWTGEGESFNVQYRTAGEDWVLVEDVTSPYTLTGLTPGTDYEVQVQNYCGTDGFSNWSNLVTFTTLICPTPTGLTVTNVTKNSAVISWTENGSATVWQLHIDNHYIGMLDVYENPYTLTGLNAGTEYTVQVVAYCGAILSDLSEELTFTTDIPCHATEDLHVTAVTPNSATLDWTGEGDNFEMQYRTSDGEWVSVSSVTPPYTLTNLASNTNYEVQVKNICSGLGASEWSNTATFATSLCPAPANLTVTNITKNSAVLSWTETGTATAWELSIDNYHINLLDIGENPYTLTGLSAGTEYTVKVSAVCGASWSDWSNEVTFTTEVACTPTEDLAVTDYTYNTATLNWTGEGNVFHLRHRIPGGEWIATDGIVPPYTLTGLNPGTTYEAQVQNECIGGNQSEWSNLVTFTTSACDPQAIPYAYDFETEEPFYCWSQVAGDVELIQALPSQNHTPNGQYSLAFYESASDVIAFPQFTQEVNTLQVSFWVRPHNITMSGYGTFSVGYLTDVNDASTFTAVSTYSYDEWPGTIDFLRKIVTLQDAPAGAIIAFKHDSPTANGTWYVDDILVSAICDVPTGITVSNITNHSATVTWTDNGASSWDVTLNSSMGYAINVTTNQYTFDNLTPGTNNYVMVRSRCGDDIISNWSEQVTFTTLENSIPTYATITGDSTVCYLSTTLLTAHTDVPATYLWSNGATTQQINVGAGTYQVTVTSATGNELASEPFTLTENPSLSGEESRSICPSELPYTWNGHTFPETGMAFVTLTASNGCDSIVTMILSVNPTFNDTIEATICEGESYHFSGQDLTESGVYTDSLQTIKGCDSVTVLTLIVNPSYALTVEQTVCESELPIVWNGKTFNEAGTQTATLQTVNECDSVVTMTLHVNPTYNIPIEATICSGQTYNFHGQILTTGGEYTHPMQTVNGCDSVEVLTLTVNPTYSVSEERSVCSGALPYTWNGITFNAPGTKFVTLQTVNGCDSVVTMILSVSDAYEVTVTRTVCASELPIVWNGKTFTGAGTQIAELEAGNGCDSIVTMVLTVNTPVNTATTAESCGSYTWTDGDGLIYTESGTHYYEHPDAHGCTQVDTLYLTIYTPTNTAITEAVCGSYTWTGGNGVTYTESGTYYYEHQDAHNCTQVDTLYLTIYTPTNTAITETACGSYTWTAGDGVTYTESGTHYFEHPDAHGCTQVDTLYLTINNPVNTVTTEESCGNYTWAANGQTYYASGEYTYSHQDANGCTQVDTLRLTILQGSSAVVANTICASELPYEWNGVTFTAAGMQTATIEAANGCDSVITMVLMVNTPVNTESSAAACESYTWAANGVTYYESGEYTYAHPDINGCTQVDTLHLTIYTPEHTAITVAECGSYSWTGGTGITYTESGEYTYAHTDAHGCTQVDTLHLTIYTPEHTAITVAECGSYSWTGGTGITYTESGTYYYAHQDAHGCTQVDTLYLTIHNPVAEVVEASACGSYTWAANGQTYAVSGEYTYAHTDAHGCTQVDTLRLTILQGSSAVLTSTICASELPYVWNGVTFTEAGMQTTTLTAVNGCDSVVTMVLTVNAPPVNTAITATECSSYTWAANGQTYYESGTYTYSHPDVNGCTQVDTLYLTINHPVNTAITVSECGSYTWNGQTYTTSGVYTYSHTDANGCTQVDTLYLTISQSVQVELYETACGSYTWNGQTYTQSNDYSATFTAANGCDSIVVLHLTVYTPANTAITVEECDSYTWTTGNGQTYTTSGDYTYSHEDANGCTQVDTLHLTIHYATTSEFTIETPDSCYTWNGQSYCASGDYVQTLQTVNGCDSVVTLHLTTSVGVSDHEVTTVFLAPNPTQNICRIMGLETDPVSVDLYDMRGKLVMKASGRELDVTTLPTGLYMVKIFTGDRFINLKLVKQ